MRTVLTHRIELKPNPLQEAVFRQCVGAARFAYNWALAEWQRQYASGEKPNEAARRGTRPRPQRGPEYRA